MAESELDWSKFVTPVSADLQKLSGPSTVEEYRIEAHKWFDRLWRYNPIPNEARTVAYCHLAEFLQIPLAEAHIKKFDIETCKKAITWAKRMVRG